MFVSPPPATLTTSGFQVRHNSNSGNYHYIHNQNNNNNNNTNSIKNLQADNYSAMNDTLTLINSNQSIYSGTTMLTDTLKDVNNIIKFKKDSDFVNAPPEYANRARDEIKKRLLLLNNTSNDVNGHTTINSDNTNRDNSSGGISRIATLETIDQNSIITDNASSYQSSIFSNTNSLLTNNSQNSQSSQNDNYKIRNDIQNNNTTAINNIDIYNHFHIPNKINYITEIKLEDALPKSFYDMYTPDILFGDQSKLLCNGRPSFTKRELLDWDLNDIRSLLIVEHLKPEWGNTLPKIICNGPNLPKFKLQLLPLNSSDEFIINVLINSDLYMEANLDHEFKLTSAKYTVAAARKRHEQMTDDMGSILHLSKPEWRNIIENYLLNIAVEAQCRFDFKQRCSEFKKWKLQQLNLKKPHMPPPRIIPKDKLSNNNPNNGNINRNSSNLLKLTLMKNFNNNNIKNLKAIKSNDENINSNNPNISLNNQNININSKTTNNSQMIDSNPKISITQEEKSNIWLHCQAQVYQRLGLDWKPDGMR